MLIDIVAGYDTDTKDHLKSVWTEIIKFLDAKHDSKKILTFLSKCAVISIDEKEKIVHLGIPNDFVLSQVQKFFKKPLAEAIHETYNKEYKLSLIAHPDLQNGHHDLQIEVKDYLTWSLETRQSSPTQTAVMDAKTTSDLSNYFGILFEKKYTFNNFVIGGNSELAASAAQAIAEKPGEVYNPFFIYGDVGLGKTHLMQAIGNHIIEHDPDKVIVYLPCTKFIDKIIHAVRFNKLEQLKQKLEEVDVLMIDDIQFLAGKDKTQEIFHNIFNDFYAKGKQIVITSDESPKALTLLEPRLQSRFSLGLVVDIKPPDLETRIAILQSKAQKKDIQLETSHIEMIAESVDTNIRELEWALNIVMTKKQLLKRDLTEQDIFESLDTLGIQDVRKSVVNEMSAPDMQPERSPSPSESAANTVDTVPLVGRGLGWGWGSRPIPNTSVSAYEKKLHSIATYYWLEVEKIRWNSRTKEISFARQCAMYIAKTQFNRSLQKIGNYFWGKNHSTVIYAIKKFESTLKSDKQTQEILKGF